MPFSGYSHSSRKRNASRDVTNICHARRRREHGGDKCCPIKQVFKIIEQQQQCFVVQIVEQLLLRITFAVERHAKRLGDGRNKQIAASKWL